ncbi:MAG: hypothetical protein ABSE43_10790 [Steroidobacteraceae bacterium]|jgi:hypothetical protein
MVQPSIPEATMLPASARHALALPGDDEPAHDEGLLVAALERIEVTRLALEELLSAELSGLLFV